MWPNDFPIWAERHWPAAFHAALGRCRDPALAQDAAQEAMAQAARHMHEPGYFTEDHFLHFVIRVALNHVTDHHRRATRRRTGQMPDSYDAAAPRSDVDAAIEEWLEPLTEEQRRIVRLVIIEEYTLAEAASVALPPDERTEKGRVTALWRMLRGILAELRDHLRRRGQGPNT